LNLKQGRHQPAKIAALAMLLPTTGVAMLMDGHPEMGRGAASLTFFVIMVDFVAVLQAGIAFDRIQLDDSS
jgi:hypothetical protein